MFIYEKNKKLNLQFGPGQIPVDVPTMEISEKEIRVGATIVPENGEIVTKAVVMNGEYFDTLQEAVESADIGNVITLLTNAKVANFEIPNGKEVVLDLNGFKIENDGECNTITNKGTLTIKDSIGTGVVDNTVHGKAAVVNEQGAKIILNGGIYNRSKEAGTDESANGNSYYTLVNQGIMTINDGVTVLQNGGSFSSLVENGWYDGSKNTSKIEAVLIVNGGKFENGINTLKNDDFGNMLVRGGKFTNNGSGAVVLNWNKLNIIDGEFTATGNTSSVIAMGYLNDESDLGVGTISGGTFKANNVTNNLFGVGQGAKDGGSLTINGNAIFVGNVATNLPYKIIDLR